MDIKDCLIEEDHSKYIVSGAQIQLLRRLMHQVLAQSPDIDKQLIFNFGHALGCLVKVQNKVPEGAVLISNEKYRAAEQMSESIKALEAEGVMVGTQLNLSQHEYEAYKS